MTNLRAGMLLVASPALVDPNFYRSVILLLDHGTDGAVGLVLDRPLDLAVADHLPAWTGHLAPPKRVFEGGPVQRETALGLAYRPTLEASDLWHPVLGGIGLVDVSCAPDDLGGIDEARIFSGYAGWGEGQLEMELAVGSWVPVEASADDAFDPVPTSLWRRVLKRQGGEVARYATYPDDPRTN